MFAQWPEGEGQSVHCEGASSAGLTRNGEACHHNGMARRSDGIWLLELPDRSQQHKPHSS